MGFLENFLRAIGILVSVLALIGLTRLLLSSYKTIDATGVLMLTILMVTIMMCVFMQLIVVLYKIPGYRFELVTLPSLIFLPLVGLIK